MFVSVCMYTVAMKIFRIHSFHLKDLALYRLDSFNEFKLIINRKLAINNIKMIRISSNVWKLGTPVSEYISH